MRTGEYCTRQVAIIGKEETIIEAARRMREHHVGDLVVVEERQGERIPIGILTDRDIVVTVVAKDVNHLHVLRVGDVMSSELMTAREDEDLSDVLKRMSSYGIRRVPVVNKEGGLEGILSVDDLIEQVGEEMTDLAKLLYYQRKREEEERE